MCASSFVARQVASRVRIWRESHRRQRWSSPALATGTRERSKRESTIADRTTINNNSERIKQMKKMRICARSLSILSTFSFPRFISLWKFVHAGNAIAGEQETARRSEEEAGGRERNKREENEYIDTRRHAQPVGVYYC